MLRELQLMLLSVVAPAEDAPTEEGAEREEEREEEQEQEVDEVDDEEEEEQQAADEKVLGSLRTDASSSTAYIRKVAGGIVLPTLGRSWGR